MGLGFPFAAPTWYRKLFVSSLLIVAAVEIAPARADEVVEAKKDAPALELVQQTAPAAPAPGADVPTLPETNVTAPAPQQPETPPAPEPPPEPPADPLAGTFYNSPFAAPPVVGYGAPTAVTATFSNTPILQTPMSIQVIPEQLIRDTQITRLEDTFRYASGVVPTDNSGTLTGVAIRGFNSFFNKRWNGFNDQLFRIYYDLADVNRVEFLKGPAAILYGNNQPGGIINIVTKKPLAEQYRNVNLMVGQWGLARGQVDVSTPLDQDGNILFRANFMAQNSESFRDFVYDDRLLYNNSMTFVLTEDTILTAEGSFFNREYIGDGGTLPVNGDLYRLPRSAFLNSTNDNSNVAVTRVGVWLDHQFNDDWAMRIGGYAFVGRTTIATHLNNNPPGFGANAALPAGTTLQQAFIGTDNSDAGGSMGYVVGNVEALGQHEVIVGYEYNYLQNKISRRVSLTPQAFNVFNPTSNIFPANMVLFPGAFGEGYSQNHAMAGFFNDTWQFTDWARFVAGVRYDTNNNILNQMTVKNEFSRNDSQWSPRGAFLVDLLEDRWTAWYSYTRSFNAGLIEASTLIFSGNPAMPNGGPVLPETGYQHEIGTKFASEDQRLIGTLAIYQIEKQNVLQAGPVIGGVQYQQQLGGARSQGVEFDLYGQVTDNFSLVANYAYTDARVTAANATNQALIGTRLVQIPYNVANLWGRYNLIDRVYDQYENGTDKKMVFGLGYGLRWLSDSKPAGVTNLFTYPVQFSPGYVVHDVGAFFERGSLFANLYVDNVFDRTYFYAPGNSGFLVGTPISARMNFGIRY